MDKMYTLAAGLLVEKYSCEKEEKEEKKEKKTIAAKVQKDEKKEDVEESGKSGSSVPEVDVDKVVKIAKKLVELGKKLENSTLEKAAKTILELCGEEIEDEE